MPTRRSDIDKFNYFAARQGADGKKWMTQQQAADLVGINIKTAKAWDKGLKSNTGDAYREMRKRITLGAPKQYSELSKEARKAHDDFSYFRRRYFGRISSPWQEDAGYKFNDLLKTSKREFVVLNCPPGSGKSVLLKDIEAWLTVRNRGLRGIIGSATQRKAESFCRALAREFERTVPLRGEPSEVEAGRARDAEAVLAADFGRFKPELNDVWRANEFVVAQLGEITISEKESTWQAFGLDGDYLGNRVDIQVWDDVMTEKKMKTIEVIADQRRKWDKEVETRLQQGGALFNVMQRKGPEDLSRWCLDKLGGDLFRGPTEDDLVDPEGSMEIPKKYHHFKYPAHDEARCHENHSIEKPRYWSPKDPEACLIDPVRLSYYDLQGYQRTDNEDYLITYQQEDTDPKSVLVNRLWITGGTDPGTGEEFFGCYDKNRSLMECPPLDGDVWSVLAVDPSPTKFWGILWTCYHPESQQRFMMNALSAKMEASQFLDWNYNENKFMGLLEDWWQDSVRAGQPIKHLIFERNAAQRFFGQFDHFRRWCLLRGVSYYPHDTSDSNKNSREFGVETIVPHFKYGRWRLPNRAKGDMGFVASRYMVDELCVYPLGAKTDLVMATWFSEWWFPKIVVPSGGTVITRHVPQWVAS